MSKKILVLFNGAPQSGKDTAAEFVVSKTGAKHIKLSAVLKNMTHGLYGIDDVPFDHFEDVKDKPNQLFLGLTPRQAYINVAEKLLKPVHGQTIFAQKTFQDFTKIDSDIVVVSDLGFQLEYDYFKENLLSTDGMITVIVNRPGKDFSNDSRQYVVSDKLHTWTLDNASTKDKYFEQVEDLIQFILKQTGRKIV